MMFAVGTLLVSNLALTSPWLQVLSNYPVEVSEKQHHRGIGSNPRLGPVRAGKKWREDLS